MDDYKEKYEHGVECIQEILSGAADLIRTTTLRKRLQPFFPELKESKEDKIMRVIRGWIYTRPASFFDNGISKEEILAWVEKQGQKEATWNKEDEENMNNVLYILHQLKDTSSYEEDNIAEKAINWFKSLKDRLCSNNEYDKDMLGAIEYCKKNNRPLEKEHLAWLEKQGEQNPVRWSEEDEKIKESIKKVLANTNFNKLDIKYSFYEMISWLEKQKDYIEKDSKLPNSTYTSNKDVIEFADKYSHDVWEKLMDNFNKIKNYSIGCNDVSDIVLNAIINTYNWLEKQDKEEYALKSSRDEDVNKFMQYIEKQAKAYDFNLPNRGYDIYAFAKDILIWREKQGEKKYIINVPPREVILSIWDLGNEWKELTNGCISTEYGTQLEYIQRHWHESEYYLKEKQGEKKPIFNADDWYVSKVDGKIHNVKFIEKQDEPASDTKYEVKIGDSLSVGDGQPFDYEKATITQNNFEPKTINEYTEATTKQNPAESIKDYNDIDPHFGIPVEDLMSNDKTEPKFKALNWYQCTKDFFGKGVTFDKNTAYYCAIEGCLQNEYGCHIAIVEDLYDNFKLWTIEDAKDGDVLTANIQRGELGYDDYPFRYIQITFIYRKTNNDDYYIHSHCDMCFDGILNPSIRIFAKDFIKDIYPAAKGQRDLLFQKIKEEGYEWDSEKKELKRIESEFDGDDILLSLSLGNNQVQDILEDMGMLDDNGQCPHTAEEIFKAGMEYAFNLNREVASSVKVK